MRALIATIALLCSPATLAGFSFPGSGGSGGGDAGQIVLTDPQIEVCPAGSGTPVCSVDITSSHVVLDCQDADSCDWAFPVQPDCTGRMTFLEPDPDSEAFTVEADSGLDISSPWDPDDSQFLVLFCGLASDDVYYEIARSDAGAVAFLDGSNQPFTGSSLRLVGSGASAEVKAENSSGSGEAYLTVINSADGTYSFLRMNNNGGAAWHANSANSSMSIVNESTTSHLEMFNGIDLSNPQIDVVTRQVGLSQDASGNTAFRTDGTDMSVVVNPDNTATAGNEFTVNGQSDFDDVTITSLSVSGTSGAGRFQGGTQSVTCADSGDGSPGAATLDLTAAVAQLTNSDADGCVWAVSETSVGTTSVWSTVVIVSNAGGVNTFPDVSNVWNGQTLCTDTGLAVDGAFTAFYVDAANDHWISTSCIQN